MREYFLGGNTPDGFINYYNQAIDFKEGNNFLILKGGSGVGKSTFLKKIAETAKQKNYVCDLCRCSSDVNSLDGIIINDKNLAIIDGTSPHLVDPIAYGIYDKIIDLGVAIDKGKLKGKLEKINELINRKKQLYIDAYDYIYSAKTLYSKNNIFIDKNALIKSVNEFTENLKIVDLVKQGKNYKRFSVALSSSGFYDTTNTLKNDNSINILACCDNVAIDFLDLLAKKLIKFGYDIETFCSPLEYAKPLSIYIKQLNIYIFYYSFLSNSTEYDNKNTFKINNNFDKTTINKNNSIVKEILDFAYSCMEKAFNYHTELEKIYNPAVNFELVGEIRQKTICDFL